METPQDHRFQYPEVKPVTSLPGRRLLQGSYIPPEMMKKLPEQEKGADIIDFQYEKAKREPRHIPGFQLDPNARPDIIVSANWGKPIEEQNISGSHLDRSRLFPDD